MSITTATRSPRSMPEPQRHRNLAFELCGLRAETVSRLRKRADTIFVMCFKRADLTGSCTVYKAPCVSPFACAGRTPLMGSNSAPNSVDSHLRLAQPHRKPGFTEPPRFVHWSGPIAVHHASRHSLWQTVAVRSSCLDNRLKPGRSSLIRLGCHFPMAPTTR
jgi:hypothetical protein